MNIKMYLHTTEAQDESESGEPRAGGVSVTVRIRGEAEGW